MDKNYSNFKISNTYHCNMTHIYYSSLNMFYMAVNTVCIVFVSLLPQRNKDFGKSQYKLKSQNSNNLKYLSSPHIEQDWLNNCCMGIGKWCIGTDIRSNTQELMDSLVYKLKKINRFLDNMMYKLMKCLCIHSILMYMTSIDLKQNKLLMDKVNSMCFEENYSHLYKWDNCKVVQ